MPALNQDFTAYKDSTLYVNFVFTGYDPSTATAIWIMKGSDGQPILTKKSSLSELVMMSDHVILKLLPIDTVDLPAKQYIHELRISEVDLDTAPVSIGIVTLKDVLTASIY